MAACVAGILAACGGGDGGQSGAGVGSGASQGGAPTSAGPTTAVAPAIYATGSEELAAFNFLNAERGRCGFGLLSQDTRLDAAAKAHADYQLVNNVLSHFEDRASFPTGFTGGSMVERYAFQGYTGLGGAVDEISAVNGTADKKGFGVQGVRNLLNAPYHLKGLVSGMRDAGLAVRSSGDTGTSAPRVILQWNGAYTQAAGSQGIASADVLTYPCEGTTGAARMLGNESPEPVPGRDLRNSPLGTTVYIAARAGNTLAVSSVAMTNSRTGAAVPLRNVVTAGSDPQGEYAGSEAYVAADTPLDANTAYKVALSGSNNGAAFTRTFTFTTGP